MVNQQQLAAMPRLRLAIAICLGVISMTTSLLLVVVDGLDASVKWTHHAGISAAPLLLVAGAIATASIAHPPKGRQVLMRLVAAIAFATWGFAQLFPSSAAAGGLEDAAILLFVVDAGCAVISDALNSPANRPPSRPRERPGTI